MMTRDEVYFPTESDWAEFAAYCDGVLLADVEEANLELNSTLIPWEAFELN